MEILNVFTSDIKDIRECLRGPHGTDITENTKITYLGGIIMAEGNLDDIKKNCTIPVYDWKSIGNDLYIGWVKNV